MENEFENMAIDYDTLEKIEENDELRKIFIEKFATIVENENEISYIALSSFCNNSEIKSLILDNISEIIAKIDDRELAMKYVIPKSQIIANPQMLFVKSSTNNKVNYREIIQNLEKYMSESEVMQLVINNLDNVIKDSGSNFSQVIEELNYIKSYVSNEQVEQLDEKLVQNMDNILQIRIDKGGYNIYDFSEFPKFIEEIRKRGPEFFINFPITNSKKEYKKIAEEIFGKYDEEIFSILEFGKYDKTKAEMMKYIVSELINASSEGTTVNDIKEIGSGSYAIAYKIGDYTLKIGTERGVPEIPNHRRLLQPIIRRKIITDRSAEENPEVYDFVEVQNYVDTSCLKSMYPGERVDILYEIYSELRDDGYVWLDPTYKNIGKLLKPNKANLPYTDIDGTEQDFSPIQDSTGVKGEISKKDILEPGKFVIIDTDYIIEYNEQHMKERKYEGGRTETMYDLEERYLKEKAEKEQQQNQR